MKIPFLSTSLLTVFVSSMISLGSCKKNDHPGNSPHPAMQSSEVIDKWIMLQIRLMKNTTGVANHAFSRPYAYSGIAAFEAIAPGLPQSVNVYRKWNGLNGLPLAENGNKYYYPANVNAALAAMNRSMFPNASAADKASIDSLELALTQQFLVSQPVQRISKSVDFGKAVALAVFNWSETDGYKNANNPYTPPQGPGIWNPIAPATTATTPYWGNNRPVVTGSIDNTGVPAPLPYSTDPASPFFKMVKELYDSSFTLTAEQKAMAHYWKDVPGATSPGHWLSILQQVIKKKNAKLDKSAVAYALTGAAINDALISCMKSKYQYLVVRPVTYTKSVIGDITWAPLLGTPNHPEYPSAHSALSAGAAVAFQKIFGDLGTLTDHTYDYLGYGARTYHSFNAIAEDASISRFYGGIHYKPSLTQGLEQGRKVAANIFNTGN